MKPGQFLLLIIIFVLVVLGAGHFAARDENGEPAANPLTSPIAESLSLISHETAFERVMRTNTIRCGYYVYPPVTYRDPNTGELSGFSVDMMNLVAAQSGLKVEWTEEIGFGTWPEALKTGRIDVSCTPNWPSIAVGRAALIGTPMLYSKIFAIGRAGDTRFKSLADLNKPTVKISLHEGNDVYHLVRLLLPNATLVTLAPNAEPTQPIMDVLAKKADVMISDMNAVHQWNMANTSKVAVAVPTPLKLQGFSLAVGQGEHDLMAFLENAVRELQATNSIETTMRKWMKHDDVYLYPAALRP